MNETDPELVERALAESGLAWKYVDDASAAERAATAEQEWLEWRRAGIGASDVAGILGLSPWSSPYAVWALKVGLIGQPEQTEAMEFGQLAEPMLAKYFERYSGLWAVGEQTRVEHPDNPWMRCTVDAFAYEPYSDMTDPTLALAAIEYKTTSEAPEVWEREVPLHYACQATWTALVTGASVIMFGVLHIDRWRRAFRIYTFQPSPDDLELVARRVTRFWVDHVLTGTPPPVDAESATTEALQEAWSADPDLDAVEADPRTDLILERIAANQQRIADCQRIIDEQKNLLREAMGAHTVLTLGRTDKGKPRIVATWRDEHRAGYVVEESTTRVLRVPGARPRTKEVAK